MCVDKTDCALYSRSWEKLGEAFVCFFRKEPCDAHDGVLCPAGGGVAACHVTAPSKAYLSAAERDATPSTTQRYQRRCIFLFLSFLSFGGVHRSMAATAEEAKPQFIRSPEMEKETKTMLPPPDREAVCSPVT